MSIADQVLQLKTDFDDVKQAGYDEGFKAGKAEGGAELPTQTKTITPSTSEQSVTPDSGYSLSKVIIQAVTNAVDANIKAENIKEGVSILGVAGTEKGYEKGKEDANGDSLYNTFWDRYLENGNRYHYNNAFGNQGWDDTTYSTLKYRVGNKKENYRITYAHSMYSTSRITDTRYPLDFSRLGASCENVFNNCPLLVTIRELTVKESVTFNKWFINCQKLTNIAFSGTIGNNIDFKNSNLLSVESAKNIIDHLGKYAGTDKELSYTLTLNADVWTRLETDSPREDEQSWKDYVLYSLGWNT